MNKFLTFPLRFQDCPDRNSSCKWLWNVKPRAKSKSGASRGFSWWEPVLIASFQCRYAKLFSARWSWTKLLSTSSSSAWWEDCRTWESRGFGRSWKESTWWLWWPAFNMSKNWPSVHSLNFTLVLFQRRILLVSFVGLFWRLFLATRTNKELTLPQSEQSFSLAQSEHKTFLLSRST